MGEQGFMLHYKRDSVHKALRHLSLFTGDEVRAALEHHATVLIPAVAMCPLCEQLTVAILVPRAPQSNLLPWHRT